MLEPDVAHKATPAHLDSLDIHVFERVKGLGQMPGECPCRKEQEQRSRNRMYEPPHHLLHVFETERARVDARTEPRKLNARG